MRGQKGTSPIVLRLPRSAGRGWVDYATVYYWCQNVPGGFKHRPLRPLTDRARPMLRLSVKPVDIGKKIEKLQVDPQPDNTFSTEEDFHRLQIYRHLAEHAPFRDPPAEGVRRTSGQSQSG